MFVFVSFLVFLPLAFFPCVVTRSKTFGVSIRCICMKTLKQSCKITRFLPLLNLCGPVEPRVHQSRGVFQVTRARPTTRSGRSCGSAFRARSRDTST